MRLDLALTDSRIKHGTYNWSTPQTEEFERAKFDGTGNAKFIACVLRGLTDEIDPQPPAPEPLSRWERDLLRGERPC